MPQLPWYVKRAITSKTVLTAPFNLLNQDQWRQLAEHVYEDELPRERYALCILRDVGAPCPHPNGGVPGALPKGASYRGTGRYWTLRGILYEATEKHGGVEELVPHHSVARVVYDKLVEPEERAAKEEWEKEKAERKRSQEKRIELSFGQFSKDMDFSIGLGRILSRPHTSEEALELFDKVYNDGNSLEALRITSGSFPDSHILREPIL